MKGSDNSPPSSSPCSSLLCQEDKSCLNGQDNEIDNQLIYSQTLFPRCEMGYEDDYIKFLVQKERDYNSVRSNRSVIPPWLRDARSDVINWIIHTQALLGLRNQTAYLSVTYFDRFLSIFNINEDKSWVIRVLSIACLSLAVKMGEVKEVPLSKYSTNPKYIFRGQDIQKMELLVLGTLEWNMRLITPFSFLHSLSIKFGAHGINSDRIISRSVKLLMSIIKEINVIDYRPSLIAAAAVLAASDWQLTQEELEYKISTLSLLEWKTSENEELFSCYSIMQRLYAKENNLSTPSSISEDDQTPAASQSKRRKLSFSDFDQNLGLEEV